MLNTENGSLAARWRKLLILGCLFISLATLTISARATDVFGRSTSPSGPAVAPAQTAYPMPDIVRNAVHADLQAETLLNDRIEQALGASGQREGMGLLWIVIAASFLYGAIHALGPGHGKVAVSTYLASHHARVAHAAALGTWTALVQAASAIVLVVGISWILRAGIGTVMSDVGSMEFVSDAIMCLVGVWTIWAVVTRRDCCDERPLVHFSSLTVNEAGGEGVYLGSVQGNKRKGRVLVAGEGNRWIVREILATGIAAGMRPCTGAVFVLLSAQADGHYATGVLSTLAMGAGVALTVTLVAIMSVGVNRVISAQALRKRRSLDRARRVLVILGAAFIAVLGAGQCIALAFGWIQPSLT